MPRPTLKAAVTCAAAASIAMTAFAPATHAADDRQDPHIRYALDIATAYRISAKYTDERQAIKDGYVPTDNCLTNPRGPGAMGYHYTKRSLWGSTDPSKPTAIIYGPERGPGGGRRLYAIEWIKADADQDLKTTDDRPTMFGLPFNGPMPGHSPSMPIHYDLHMWAYKDNPEGLFHNWNNNVHCPPNPVRGHPADHS